MLETVELPQSVVTHFIRNNFITGIVDGFTWSEVNKTNRVNDIGGTIVQLILKRVSDGVLFIGEYAVDPNTFNTYDHPDKMVSTPVSPKPTDFSEYFTV